MKATLLGSGDPLGMPVALCDCKYCMESEERLRPGLLVQSGETSLVFDVSPDIRQQLIRSDAEKVDAFFATHAHFDHFGGVPELHQLSRFADKDITLYGSSDVEEYLEDMYPWIDLEFHEFSDNSIQVNDLRVRSFEVEHSDTLPMQGFAVEKNGKKIVYVPDLKRLPENDAYLGADLLVVDGMYLFNKHFEEDEDHASGEELERQIEKVNAEKVVLVNTSEHFDRMETEEEKRETHYTIGSDFDEFEV